MRLDKYISRQLQCGSKLARQMIAQGVLAGRLRPGERMPSSRKLAEHLGVSRITVSLAYAELVADDYLFAKGRSGYFVSQTAPQPGPLPPERAPEDAVGVADPGGEADPGFDGECAFEIDRAVDELISLPGELQHAWELFRHSAPKFCHARIVRAQGAHSLEDFRRQRVGGNFLCCDASEDGVGSIG